MVADELAFRVLAIEHDLHCMGAPIFRRFDGLLIVAGRRKYRLAIHKVLVRFLERFGIEADDETIAELQHRAAFEPFDECATPIKKRRRRKR